MNLFTSFYEEIRLAEDDEIHNVNDEQMKEDAADETDDEYDQDKRVLCVCVGGGVKHGLVKGGRA